MSPARGQTPLMAYDAVYLECRNLGHVWRVAGYYRDGEAVLRRLGCARCSTERTDRWRRDGFRLSARYTYVDGYRMGPGEGVSPGEVRVEMLRRANVYRNEAEMIAAMTGAAR